MVGIQSLRTGAMGHNHRVFCNCSKYEGAQVIVPTTSPKGLMKQSCKLGELLGEWLLWEGRDEKTVFRKWKSFFF